MMQNRKSVNLVMMIVMVLFLICSISVYATGVDNVSASIVRIGYFELDGFNDVSPEGAFSGYGYEVLMEISKYTGWRYEFIYKTMDSETQKERRLTYLECLDLLGSGQIDMMCYVRKTPDRLESFSFPDASFNNVYGILSTSPDNDSFLKS